MAAKNGLSSPFQSPTFDRDLSIAVDDDIGAASISPAGRDVVLASKSGLRIIDLDNPYSLPLFIRSKSSWDVADVQWSPFAARAEWIASTQNQNALVYNLTMPYSHNKPPIEFKLRAHARAITDINFSAHHPDLLATCGVDSFVFVHDLRSHRAPHHAAQKFADWEAGATQVKWNRQNDKIIASAHDKYLHIWDLRRGATPLSTITAHTTKIYGIDWNRSDESKILTCSLDSTIKLWNDVGKTIHISAPHHSILTNYPVWRARHTPFPGGILAMPQRGNSNLWLYKQTDYNHASKYTTKYEYAFEGHEPDAQVREFLWRTRGSTDNGIDDREFQLVSWGTDRHLRLHRLSPELLERTVDHCKGRPLMEKWTSTRRGAKYITFADGSKAATFAKPAMSGESALPQSQRKGNLSTLFDYSRVTGLTPSTAAFELPMRETMTAQPVRRKVHQDSIFSGLKWISGVKFGNRHNSVNNLPARPNQNNQDLKQPSEDKQLYQEQTDLGAEISLVGNKYKKLTFERIDVPGRSITVSFNGPWGEYNMESEEQKLVFLRFIITFPATYPKARTVKHPNQDPSQPAARIPSPLEIKFERTTAPLSKDMQDILINKMKLIADTCARHEREALEAVLAYALGARALDASLYLIEDDLPPMDFGQAPGESSSEDESNEEGEFNNDVMQSSHTNANIPLPVQCTVRFSTCGFLVLARIPSSKSVAGLDAIQLRIGQALRYGAGKDDIFESFGRFTTQHPHDSDADSSETSSVGSWEGSSSRSSSSASHRVNARMWNFGPLLAWQKAASRIESRNSLPSSSGAITKPVKTKSVVSILSSAVDDLVPSKRFLAEEYRIFGPGPWICEHNSNVARKHGLEDLADIWILCKLILNNEVPLEVLSQTHRRDQVLVLARRALVKIKRKDSGSDLKFDEADTVTNPRLRGRIKWGNHTVVSWLIPALFDHFERLADTQMLAMLSCIFAEPAAREGITSSMSNMRQSQLPMSMEAPAFSLDYFSSSEAAWSLFRPTISIPSTPSHSRFATPVPDLGWQRLARNLDTYGSHGSSNGPWGSDTVNSEPLTPFSTDNTPPNLSRASTVRSAQTAGHTPYSTSPEQSHAGLKKSSTTNFANAMAALSRPFANAVSSSPPVKSRIDDLSTSAPTSAVTWGTTTFYGGDSHDRRSLAPSRSKHGKRASFGQSERVDVSYIDDSDSEYDRAEDEGYRYRAAPDSTAPGTPVAAEGDQEIDMIKVILKNQDQFDDDACVSRPLLDSSKDWLHRAWREQYAEMLSCWGLVSTRAEVLKFNGLVSYFPVDVQRAPSKAGSMCLTIKKEEENDQDNQTAARRLTTTSTTLMPGSAAVLKRSPAASLRNFSFNPEAREFQPGTSSFTPPELLATLPEMVVSTEQYLQLSIPVPTPSKELGEGLGGLATSPSQNKLHPYSTRASRPSLSRGTSNVSGTSSWRSSEGRSNHQQNNNTTTTSSSTAINTAAASSTVATAIANPPASTPIYSCAICWIRVCGRFYLCPACGHVAHFECMDDSLSQSSDDCIVGCSCGCGIEPQTDERSRMEAYLEGVRAANAAGTAWSDAPGAEWAPSSRSQPVTPGGYTESEYDAEYLPGGAFKMTVYHDTSSSALGTDHKRLGTATTTTSTTTGRGIGGAGGVPRGGSHASRSDAGASRQSTNRSPTPTSDGNVVNRKKKTKKSKKKKVRASALSYY